jgi:hypothetical protein
LIYRGVLADTGIITPLSDTSAYIILDTVNHRFYNYNRATNVWSVAGGGTAVTSITGGTGLTGGTITTSGTLAADTSFLFTQSDTLGLNLTSRFAAKQNNLTLTTTGTSGASTLVGATLNIPQYSGGGGISDGDKGDIDVTNSGATWTIDTSAISLSGNKVTGTLPVANGGTNASTFTAGSVVFAGVSGTYTQDNANLFYDNTNDRLGIATSTPRTILDVKSVKLNAAKLATANGVAVFENDVTNDDTPDYQAYAITNTLRYRGTQGTNNSTRGIIGNLVSNFNYSTGTVSEMSGFYLDLRNMETGTVTNAYGMKIPNFENASGTITNKYGFYSDIANSGATNKWNIYVNGAAPNYFNGNVAIGTTIPTEALHVVGNGRFTAVGAGTFSNNLNITSTGVLTTATSDAKYKYNIRPLNYGLETLLQLNPVNFQWIEGEEEDLGFIAQDVAEIIPEAVNTNWNSDLLFRYESLIPILTKAIQEQQALIKALEQRIINLENK